MWFGILMGQNQLQWFLFGCNPEPEPNRQVGIIANTTPPTSLAPPAGLTLFDLLQMNSN